MTVAEDIATGRPAADAISQLILAIAQVRVPAHIWRLQSAWTAQDVRRQLQGKQPYRVALALQLRRALDSAETLNEQDFHALDRSVDQLLDVLRQLRNDRELDDDAQDAVRWVGGNLISGRRTRPAIRRDFEGGNPHRDGLRRAIGLEEAQVDLLVDAIRRARQYAANLGSPGLVSSRIGAPETTSRALDLLVSRADAAELATLDIPEYDAREAQLRITNVTVRNFRGVTRAITIPMMKNNQAVSAVIFGENGVGKSSFVDAIEFALQGRIGRSSDFESPLLGNPVNYASDDLPSACVGLNDGTDVSRNLVQSADARIVADTYDVRAGFRLAPLTLKRADILSFLETDADKRGMVFFDYFPPNPAQMAERPEQEARKLQSEQHDLRIRRDALASSVAEYLEIDVAAVASNKFLKETLAPRAGLTTVKPADLDRVLLSLEPDVADLVREYFGVKAQYSRNKGRVERITNQLNPVVHRQRMHYLTPLLSAVGEELTATFQQVTDAKHVTRIRVLAGVSGPTSLDIIVEMANGRTCYPQQIFSEGWRDLLAVLFFLAMAKQAATYGQAKVLVLDDVFQSVDAGVRLHVMDYLLKEFADWQLIITLHDRLWLEQTRALMRRHSKVFIEHRIARWSFEGGPLQGDPIHAKSALETALRTDNPQLVTGAAGFLLERLGDALTLEWRSSLQRQLGDMYTLQPLWDAVKAKLKKSSAREVVDRIDMRISLRNQAGAHYNEWAESVPWSDAERFGYDVLDLWSMCHCNDCGSFVNASLNCRCGTRRL